MSNVAVSAAVVLEGHLIDSLTLAKVIDSIQKQGGDYITNHIQIGGEKQDISSASITVTAPDDGKLESILNELAPYGVKTAMEDNASTQNCPAKGEPPDGALAVKLPAKVKLNGQWVAVEDGGTELYLVVSNNTACLKHHQDLTPDDTVVVSHSGVQWR